MDSRKCAQCGSVFSPRREHARFCSPRCRVAWNREQVVTDRVPEFSALEWSRTAMCDATGRLRRVRSADRPRALAAISEAVWWVTIVDATLVRYHPVVYDEVLAAQAPADRRLTEDILGGLRFVRNRMGHHLDPADFVCPVSQQRKVPEEIGAWAWASLPEPGLDTQSARGRDWELSRYRAYQDQLAGRAVGETFTRAVAFLELTASQADTQADGPAQPSEAGSVLG